MATTMVKFEASRENRPMAVVDGKIAFPERYGKQPAIGEIWEVEVAGTNPSGKVAFLRLLKKVELVEWSWNDGMGSRSRHPACLVITAAGVVHRFTGSDIPGVVKVVKTKYEKNGKWSNSTYHCVSPQGTKTYSWSQSWEEGLYWPQASWEEAVKTVQQSAPQVDPASLEAAIREHWGKAAAKFDENRQALVAFAQVAESAPEPALDPGKIYFGFALADSMFVGDCTITRRTVPIEEVKALVAQGVESCCNPSHSATIDAMRSRFGIEVSIPETPPRVALGSGDSVVIMGVRGLPRLTDRHEYTEDEIASATFSFAMYTVA